MSVQVVSRQWKAEAVSSTSSIDVKTGIISGEPYAGEYEVTPGAEAQTLSTAGCTLAQDITIAAIPNNYGLITWDGSTLMVS